MSVDLEVERQVRTTMNRYCEHFDRADFAAFATLFEHGQWFMVDTPGSEPVLTWLRDHVVLHDGRTLTRHEIHDLDVEVADDGRTAGFRCSVTIWQTLPGRAPDLLVQGRWAGTFELVDGRWWWSSHTAVVDHAGDLSRHVRGVTPG